MSAPRVEHAYQEIKRRIVHALDPPGTPLAEQDLARRLHTSRTPVREALTRLLEEGYVERVPARGFFVARVTISLVQDVLEVRRLLEGAAAARAAELADEQAVSQLRALATYEYPAGGKEAIAQAIDENTRFHIAVAQASRNAIFVDMVRHCLDQVTRLIALGLEVDPLQVSSTVEHEAIVEAVASRDPEAARRAMERHLDGSTQRMMGALVRGDVRAVTVGDTR